MIGTQPTGAIAGVVITAVSHEGLTVSIHGRPGRLAIVTDDGQIVAAGPQVAREAEAVAVNSYRQMLCGQGHLRVLSKPILDKSIAGAGHADSPASQAAGPPSAATQLRRV